MSAKGLADKTRVLDAASTGGPDIEVMRGYWAELQNRALELAGQEERVDHRSLEAQREVALSLGDTLKAEELDREPELKLGPAANAIERRAQLVAESEGRDYEPLTQRGARVHAVRQAKAMFAEMRERLELARDAWAKAREEGQGGGTRKWTPTRSRNAWRGLPGVRWVWGRITRRGRALGTYAVGLSMYWAKPGQKTRRGKKPVRRNASRSWTTSASGS
jgi:hypothetical protein